jgi:hypothetical protein
MTMQMTGSNGVLSVPSEHLPGLIALVIVPLVAVLATVGCRALRNRNVGWAATLGQRLDELPFMARTALFALSVGAIVHAALVPTHWASDSVTAILFVVDAAGFAVVFWWTFGARRYWRLAAVAMLLGSAGAYTLYILRGWETVDLVGLVTTTVELAAGLVLLVPARWSIGSFPSGGRLVAAAALPVALLSLLGTSAIASSPQAASAAPTSQADGGMQAMAPTAPETTKALSLSTTSPAGPIAWPDDMGTMGPGMEMATPNCTAQPKAAQQQAAVALVDQTAAATAPYKSLAAARAAGYVPVTPTGRKIVHYINPSIYRQGQPDPSAVPALVYVNTTHGAVLSAAMYLAPHSASAQNLPRPGGCLTQWHIHTDLCFGTGRVVGTDRAGSCSPGSANETTQPMMHVWLAPVSGGPLAPDPPPLSEVAAANQLPVLNPSNGTA